MAAMKTITVHTDGGARGNPGPAGIGIYVMDEAGEMMAEYSEYIGETTNNVAEYTAVQRALEHLAELMSDTKALNVNFKLDSQLVERQLNGVYKIKDANLKTYADTIKAKLPEFASVTFTHVLRAENKEADRLANEAMDEAA